MQNRAHAGHLLCGGGVELGDLALGDRGLDRNTVYSNPGKWKSEA